MVYASLISRPFGEALAAGELDARRPHPPARRVANPSFGRKTRLPEGRIPAPKPMAIGFFLRVCAPPLWRDFRSRID
ncbi:MAG: hypothetical protein HOI95_07135 [Chromatiales bacterium]|nr:hypothetical protein [Chromatiales bacterium]